MVNLKVLFLHPDLGIGGAERAVIDAALALKSQGHQVHFVTSHHDINHCFQETRDGTLSVTTVGDWLPRGIFGRCQALCAYLRMLYAALFVVFSSPIEYDVIFCDQISACIYILKLFNAKVLFYCHFPDMLLTKRESLLKKWYRAPIDWLEEKTTGMADCVLVNSKFTAGIFNETFKSLSNVNPKVLYPIPNFKALDQPLETSADIIPPNKTTIFLSINRYERKKNLNLAVESFGMLQKKLGNNKGVHLIMAGGYDERVMENKEHYLELKELVHKLGLEDHVTFLRSFSDSDKRTLLSNCTCLLYTPDKEHFGIVPVEAMYIQCPVIAVQSGGPLETVEDGKTGFLCPPEPKSFMEAMEKFVSDKSLRKKMGSAGRKRVEERFSFNTFTKELNSVIEKVYNGSSSNSSVLLFTLALALLINICFAVLYVCIF
ncbi:alpha-1,3/1,6-mannosyltransferase ALG2-like [Mytilus galloprovincialis]|uniref:Alpha-1,3/1,6-mannosyltransferase ALG2 n=1 Tax=Mytilus galloprovincialis TaxID=29158 RepID=A0A8B6EWU6_MYTGA|nr:alpha-1,3/alpha-1,6-mannosyltransferase [Mytilus galloprovincialis]